MKIGVVSSILGGYSLEESLGYLSGIGAEQLELGVGGYPGKAHADALKLAGDEGERARVLSAFEKNNMEISAFAVHGNCVHPDRATAKKFQDDFEAACVAAGKMGVQTLVTFSGCPGSDPSARQPSWVTCAWPPEYREVLDWQWKEVLVPYWKEAAAFAASHGVKKIALELHPGFCVYNPQTLLRLREAAGDVVGANLDPSHLWWQGMDIAETIRELGPAIHHFHAKDVRIDEGIAKKKGVLDTVPLDDIKNRSWAFCTLGYGHGADTWKKIVAALRLQGYDGTFSIEHEDGLTSPKEGLEKAVAFARQAIFCEKNDNMWWA